MEAHRQPDFAISVSNLHLWCPEYLTILFARQRFSNSAQQAKYNACTRSGVFFLYCTYAQAWYISVPRYLALRTSRCTSRPKRVRTSSHSMVPWNPSSHRSYPDPRLDLGVRTGLETCWLPHEPADDMHLPSPIPGGWCRRRGAYPTLEARRGCVVLPIIIILLPMNKTAREEAGSISHTGGTISAQATI